MSEPVLGMDCANCGGDTDERPTFFDEFALDEATVIYVDAPLAGWLMCRMCRRWFAFETFAMVPGFLWHWAMVPAAKTADALAVIDAAAQSSEGWWLSVVEDLRGDGLRVRCVRMHNVVVRPPTDLLRPPQTG